MFSVFAFSFFVAYALGLTLPLIQGGQESPNCPKGLKWAMAVLLYPLGMAGGWAIIIGVLVLGCGAAYLLSGGSEVVGDECAGYSWVRIIAMAVGYVVAYFLFRMVTLGIYHKVGGWVPESE